MHADRLQLSRSRPGFIGLAKRNIHAQVGGAAEVEVVKSNAAVLKGLCRQRTLSAFRQWHQSAEAALGDVLQVWLHSRRHLLFTALQACVSPAHVQVDGELWIDGQCTTWTACLACTLPGQEKLS